MMPLRHCLPCLALLGCALSWSAEVALTVEGVVPGDGPVVVQLFDQAQNFPAGQARAVQTLAPSQAQLQLRFADLPPGRYALLAFQDRNRNQRLDISMMGMPTELYGFTRDARNHAGPPRFDQAALVLEQATLSTRLRLQ